MSKFYKSNPGKKVEAVAVTLKFWSTVKLGYNEHSVIANKIIWLVGLR